MTTLFCEREGSGKILLSLIFIIVCIILTISISSVSPSFIVNEHALEKHSYDAVVVDSCLEQGSGYLGTFKRNEDDRILKICQVDTDKFGIKVQEHDGSPVTDFIKEKLRKISQVLKYVKNRGYEPYDDVAKNLYKTVFE